MWTYRQDITGLPVPTDNFLVVAGTHAVETGQEPMSCESRYEDNEGISQYLQQLTRLQDMVSRGRKIENRECCEWMRLEVG